MTDADLRAQLSLALGGEYFLDRELDTGSKSTVFLAHDLVRDRAVVVKVLDAELTRDASAERFQRELHLIGMLQEPHTVPVLSSGHTSSGLFYYVSPYVKAPSLRERLREGPLGFDESVLALRAVAQAMAHAHRQGIVHRDLKPGKMLLVNRTAAVIDFGIARALELARIDDTASRLKIVRAVGTPGYLPPEQDNPASEADHRADIFAWGVIAYELFFEGSPLQDQPNEAIGDLASPEFAEVLQHKRYGVPRQLAELVLWCVATNPDQRPSSADEILAVLDRIPDSSTALVLESKKTARLIGASIVFAAALFTAGATAVWRLQSAGASEVPVVAVFSSSTEGVPADSLFAPGLTQALTEKLGQVRGLRVIDRRSVLAVERMYSNSIDAAKALGANYILRVTLRWFRDPDGVASVQVSPTLLTVQTGTSRWSSKPEVVFPADPFTIQSTLALATADEIGVNMSGDEQAALAARSTADTAAFRWFTLAERRYVRSMSPSDSIKEASIADYLHAAALDPGYVDAWASAALLLAEIGYQSHQPLLLDSASHLVRRARSVAPEHPRGLAATAAVAIGTGNASNAPDLLGRALYANRSLVDALLLHADLMLLSGDSATAWKDVERTLVVAPHSPDALVHNARVALALRRTGDAREYLKRAAIVDPLRTDVVLDMARADLADGNLTSMRTNLAEFRARGGRLTIDDVELLRYGSDADHELLANSSPGDFGARTGDDTVRFNVQKAQLFLARKSLDHARPLLDAAARILDSLLAKPALVLADQRRYEELRAWTDAARNLRSLELNAVTRADRSPIADQWAKGTAAASSACTGAEIFSLMGDIEQMVSELRRCLTLPGGYSVSRIPLQPALARHADDPRLRVLLEGLHLEIANKE